MAENVFKLRETQSVLTFGKHKGKTFGKVLDEEPGYAKWALNNFSKGCFGDNQKAFLQFLQENYVEPDPRDDKYLKNAWYLDPRAFTLLQYGIDPTVLVCTRKQGERIKFVLCEHMDSQRYLRMLDERLVAGFIENTNELDEMSLFIELSPFVMELDGKQYYVRPEIANCMMALHEKYEENLEQDRQYKLVDEPSKIILSHWLAPSLKGKRTHSTGRWIMFFDRVKEDEKGLTELDRAYQLLKDNFDDIGHNYYFKVSTRRPNPNAEREDKGALVVFCNEDDREDIAEKLDDLLVLERRVWWKSHDGKTKHAYDPKTLCKEIVAEVIQLEAPKLPEINFDISMIYEAQDSAPVKPFFNLTEEITI